MSKDSIALKDYQPHPFVVEHVDLTVDIDPACTKVTSVMTVVRQGDARQMWLDGENMTLISVAINEQATKNYTVNDKGMCIETDLDAFTLTIVNTVVPNKNLSGEGFYLSGSILCTQCEPEGFRKITYFIDRPDNMATYTTTMVADAQKFPYLLSNGNKVDQGKLEDGRHFVKWVDPFKKPSYLFAMVAGDLCRVQDSYTTDDGRDVRLEIFVDHGNQDKAQYALDSLKKAMDWDQSRFGLTYDLDIYMIVAVDSFNMGAMENKGLNVFNSAYTLANQETAQDVDFQNIERVIGHEYFHNWTGNRVTCRDWFQLTLKEGLTVFRDQEFTSDVNVRAVKRIEEVESLRSLQFPEDASPMRHPIRPLSYQEINNFYTPTVYQKGAEVIRMIHSILGEENFMKGMREYFARHDGQAVTTEDFVSAMETASGMDLAQFRHWYAQCGTPVVTVVEAYDPQTQLYTLTLGQTLPTGNEKSINDVVLDIPLNVALLSTDGKKLLPETQIRLQEASQSFVFSDIAQRPVLSMNRGFTAPVIVEQPLTMDQQITLLRFDDDPVRRYGVAQHLHQQAVFCLRNDQPVPSALIDAFGEMVSRNTLEPALLAKMMTVPSEQNLNNQLDTYDVEGIAAARKAYKKILGHHCTDAWNNVYTSMQTPTFTLDAASMGKRALKNVALSYLVTAGHLPAIEKAYVQFAQANNMTDKNAALCLLFWEQTSYADEVNHAFYQQYKKDALVMNKWLAMQTQAPMQDIASTMDQLVKDPVFDATNPNKIRAVYGSMAQNLLVFHEKNAKGYQYYINKILTVDAFNPQVASRLIKAFGIAQKLDPARQKHVLTLLQDLLTKPNLSNDVKEVAQSYVQALAPRG